MNTANTIFICSNCDAQFPKWLGRCSGCGAWGSVKETVEHSHDVVHGSESGPVGAVQEFSAIEASRAKHMPTGIREFDRVLSGGIVPGSLVLLAGEPGIGKSTLIAQIASALGKPVLYISGEESGPQLKVRMTRLGLNMENIRYLGETDTDTVCRTIATTKPALAMVDSIQTLTTSEYPSPAGSPAQIRAAAGKLLEIAKREGIPIVLIGQITKDGAVAGPKTLEHMVDTVLSFEGDAAQLYRLLRAQKNRFGSTDEVGVFAMSGAGLREVANPSAHLIKERATSPGSSITPILEGSRAIALELQALIIRMLYGTPQRKTSGFDVTRLAVLVAVLARRAKIDLSSVDLHVNVVGGFKITEPAADLGVVMAIGSAFRDKPCPSDLAAFGEVGLGGEIRRVSNPEKRIAELASLGITRVLVPQGTPPSGAVQIIPVATVNDALAHLSV